MNFKENQIEWFSRQIGLKLMNPAYKIDIAKVPFFDEKIMTSSVNFTPVKGIEISPLVIKQDDQTVQKYFNVFAEELNDGDEYYAEGKYTKARKKYTNILDSIQNKISDESIKKMSSYTASISSREYAAYMMEFKQEIDKVVNSAKSRINPSEKDLRNLRKDYYSIYKECLEIRNEHPVVSEKIETILKDRIFKSQFISIKKH